MGVQFNGTVDNIALVYSTMPTAAAAFAGKIVQFSGATDSNYTHGLFYECKLENSVYAWEALSPAEPTVNLTNICFLVKNTISLLPIFSTPEAASDSAQGEADGTFSVLLDGGSGGVFVAKSAGTILFFNPVTYEAQSEIVVKGDVLYVDLAMGNVTRYTEAQLLDLYMT